MHILETFTRETTLKLRQTQEGEYARETEEKLTILSHE